MTTADEREVAALSDAYEAALRCNDVDALNGAFTAGELVRFGIADEQFDRAAPETWRATAPPIPAGRRTVVRVVCELAPGVVAVDLVFDDGIPGRRGRQSQTWVREAAGWRIVRAHVSVITPA